MTQNAPENSTSQNNRKKQKAWKYVLIVLLILLILLLICGIALSSYIMGKLRDGTEPIPIVSRDNIYTLPPEPDGIVTAMPDETDTENTETPGTDTAPPETSNDPIWERDPVDPNVINILLLGRDAREKYERGRSDSMIIASYNKVTHKIKLINILRDCLVPIEGHDWTRINEAYSYGGIGLCINTLNDVFELDVQNYIIVDFDGLIQIVDAVGGIEVNLTAEEIAYYQSAGWGSQLKPGINHLNGTEALKHARNRTLGNDFERTRRQRDILIAICNHVTSSATLPQVISMIDEALDIVSTNLSYSTLVSLATDVMQNRNALTFETGRVPFDGTYRGAWYNKMLIIQIDIAENTRLLREFLK